MPLYTGGEGALCPGEGCWGARVGCRGPGQAGGSGRRGRSALVLLLSTREPDMMISSRRRRARPGHSLLKVIWGERSLPSPGSPAPWGAALPPHHGSGVFGASVGPGSLMFSALCALVSCALSLCLLLARGWRFQPNAAARRGGGPFLQHPKTRDRYRAPTPDRGRIKAETLLYQMHVLLVTGGAGNLNETLPKSGHLMGRCWS